MTSKQAAGARWGWQTAVLVDVARYWMVRAARTRASSVLCVLALCVAAAGTAQEIPAPPTPDDMEWSEPEAEAPAPLPLEDESELVSSDIAVRPRPRPAYGTMSSWDLYAGSVYANSSPVRVHAEGLLWWMRGNDLPALVTTSPAGTAREAAGVIGAPGTTIVFGDERVDDSARGGFRATAGVRLGHWFDRWMDSELEWNVLWIGDGQSSGDYSQLSEGDPILARPFFNAELGVPDSQLIAFPEVVAGEIGIETSSDFLSAGALLRRAWAYPSCGRLDWLAGYRYAYLREELLVEQFLLSNDPIGPPPVGTTFDVFDDFRTFNEFHGADLGLQFWTETHGWTVELLGKAALGATIRTVEIDGQTIVVSPFDESVTDGGLLAAPSNMGRFQSSQLSVLGEFSLRVRRPLSRFFTLTAGYSLLALNNVVRSGHQVDLVVNPTQLGGGTLVGPARPALAMRDSTVWLHGFSVGLEW